MEEDDHKVSFGSIVATIGAILIGLGIAWLLAMNWHDISSILKIIILIFITIISYSAGVLFRIHNYRKIGDSLLFLGAIIYTLSIFLIAQIFSTSVTLQGTANLLILAWVGILFASYIFNTSPSLMIVLSEFLVWISLQFFAFYEKGTGFFGIPNIENFPLGLLAIIYLAVGVLFYGLTQIHKSKDHKFFNVYRFWTAFYILLFAYILSFQTLLPLLWPSGLELTTGTLIFLITISLIAIITSAVGIIMSLDKTKLTGKEVLSFIIIIFLLITLIFSASIVSSSLGTCYLKSCYDIKNEKECNTINLPNQICSWEKDRCDRLHCENFRNQTSCENAPQQLKCNWTFYNTDGGEGYCNQDYSNKDGTINPNKDYSKQQEACSQYDNQREYCISKDICGWQASRGYYGVRDIPLKLWFIWTIDNILFIIIILSAIGYGVRYKSSKLVNLGILFFVLDIITRYIGFWIGLSGYTSFAILSIIGGIILIFGGWGIEKWRKSLIEKTDQKQQTNYKIY